MNHTKKIFWIIGSCIVLVAISTAIVFLKDYLMERNQPYEQLSMEQASEYMEYEEDYILLDVRTQEEYDEGHIPGAICIPIDDLTERVPKELTDLEQMIYVYCRSGNRSKKAAKKLCNMGYVNVTEIGGIDKWEGDIEK